MLINKCSINASYPSYQVKWINVTHWTIVDTNHTLLLNLSISWKPPNGTIKLYTIWIGGAEWNFTVQMFPVMK